MLSNDATENVAMKGIVRKVLYYNQYFYFCNPSSPRMLSPILTLMTPLDTPSTPSLLHPKSIVILDFGGQYAHLIGRRVRECGAYSEILPPETSIDVLKNAAGIILSGGPQSVYDAGSPQADPALLKLGIPVLGLCYGLHWITQTLGGEVKPGKVKEYGHTRITTVGGGGALLKDCGAACVVWMSHGDEAIRLPEGFSRIATTDSCTNAAFSDEERKIFALQFHPEVAHSEHGMDMLRRFVALTDHAPWSIENYSRHVGEQIIAEVGERRVFMLVSGGVDSTVAFTLLNETLGSHRVQGLLIDTGLMRKDEVRLIRNAFDVLGIDNLHIVDASDEFFANLCGVTEPEEKRRIIGDTFLAVQKRESDAMGLRLEEGWIMGQGTIYPDTIETGGTKHAATIKTHHNRVEAVQRMIEKGLVIEPLKELYKDEVRRLGEELGIPHALVWRHPFPGPGLGVRILCADAPLETVSKPTNIAAPHQALPVRSVGVQGDGRTYRHALALFHDAPTTVPAEYVQLAVYIPNAVPTFNRVLQCVSHPTPQPFVFTPGTITRERTHLLQEADDIVDQEMRNADLYKDIWQFPVVLLPFGLKEGGQSIVLRPIQSQEAMTANAVILPEAVLRTMVERLTALEGIDLVFLDLTNKPPATIEWE